MKVRVDKGEFVEVKESVEITLNDSKFRFTKTINDRLLVNKVDNLLKK